ncbi:MAG TPA: O-antigen ligase family protein [Patescibacteria group bacterium]|nr:O-antigen ligase family protein [Patescibacteria group bacterium]
MNQLMSIKNLRFGLFVSLIALAPLSKYPSIALPEFNFSSFRLGLYQILAAIFIILCALPTIKSLKSLFKQNRPVFLSILLLAFIAIIGLISSLYKSRSALLIASIIFLLVLVVTTWWYVKYELLKNKFSLILKITLISGIIFSLAGILQFILATFSNDTLGILCKNCISTIFGFPRVNGFAAEPQFYANALLPFFFIALGMFYKFKSRLSLAALILTGFCIMLTFSRGAFLAVLVGLAIFIILLAINKQLEFSRLVMVLLIIAITGLVGFGSLVSSASHRYRTTPNIAFNTTVSMLDHLSLGVVNIPQKTVTQVSPTNTNTSTNTNFTPPGLIQSSSQERLGAAQLALKAWRSNPYTIIFGVGAGNLGPYTIKHIDSTVPNNLTVYIFYALIIAELGLLGLASFLILSLGGLGQFINNFSKNKNIIINISIAALFSAFIAHQWFFGTYINTVYIWLWLGIILGLAGRPLDKKAV